MSALVVAVTDVTSRLKHRKDCNQNDFAAESILHFPDWDSVPQQTVATPPAVESTCGLFWPREHCLDALAQLASLLPSTTTSAARSSLIYCFIISLMDLSLFDPQPSSRPGTGDSPAFGASAPFFSARTPTASMHELRSLTPSTPTTSGGFGAAMDSSNINFSLPPSSGAPHVQFLLLGSHIPILIA